MNSAKWIVIILMFILFPTILIYTSYNNVEAIMIYYGSLYANDCGEPRGGFEWAGEYNITLKVYSDGKGLLELIFNIGLGDPLEKHEYEISNFYIEYGKRIIMKIEGKLVILNFIVNDTVWNTFHNQYIAYSNKGNIDPTIFKGFKSHYYVELRIKPKETEETLMFKFLFPITIEKFIISSGEL